jgi:ParB family chromosome partitioning protein
MDETKLHIDLLMPYPNHPFALYEGKRMDDMAESIREHGIISPIVVRPIDDGKYEILSGHNRVEASKTIGLTEVPAVVKDDLSDDEAALIVTESNLIQRSFADLRHSERAVILKNHLEAIKKLGGQGKRNDLLDFLNDEQGGQVAHRPKSRDKVAEQYALSEKTVRRYIRLAKLPKAMLDLVDADRVKFIPAVELSWLSEDELNILVNLLDDDEIKVTLKHAKRLREESEKAGGKLTEDSIMALLNEAPTKRKLRNIFLPDDVSERLAGYGGKAEKVIGAIISLYLDMLERGEVEDVLDGEDGGKA